MKKILTFIISSVLLLSSVLTSCEKVDYTKVGTIYGIVTKEGSTEPLSAVPVGLYKDNSLMLQTVTYEDGHFEFDNLLAGYYNVKIDAMGYETQEFSVYVESQRVARADMQLKLNDIGVHVITKDPIFSNGIIKLSMSIDYSSYKYTELGFYYSKGTNPVQNGKQVKINDPSSIYELKDIDSGVYYVVAYAINNMGISYGEVKSFTYEMQPIMSIGVLNVTNSSASFTCHIENANKIKIIERGFVYSSSFSNPTIDDPDSETIKYVVNGNSEDFSINVTNLSYNNKYYVRAFIKISSGVFYSESYSFVAKELDLPKFEYSGFIYQVYLDQGTMTWQEANAHCENLVYGGYSDWILPDKGALNAMYENKDVIGGFSSKYYWSSTESISNQAYIQSFYDGWQSISLKGNSNRVRCVRKQ